MSTIQDMIDEVEESLRNAPQNIVFARQSAVDNAEPLSQLFSNLSPALSQTANGGSLSLKDLAINLAEQRAILRGAAFGDILKFTLPGPGDLTTSSFTYPTTSSFIFVAYNTNSTAEVIINTTDHYIVQDRVTNDLVSIDDSPVPYLSPNAGTPFLPLNIANGKTVNDPNTANTPLPADSSSTRFDFSLPDSRIFSFTEYVADIFTQVEFVSVTGTFISGETLIGTANGEASTASVRNFLIANTSRRTSTLNISDLSDTEFPAALLVTGQSSGATGIVSTKSANSEWSLTSNVNAAVTDRERQEVSGQNYWLKDFNFVIPSTIGTGNFPSMTIPTVNSAPKIFKTFPVKQFSDNEIIANMIVITEGLKMDLSFDPFGTSDPEESVIINSSDFRNIFNYSGKQDNSDNILSSANSQNISSGQEGPADNYINTVRNPFYPAVGDASETQAQNSGIDDIQNNLYAGFYDEEQTGATLPNRYAIYSQQRWNLEIDPFFNIPGIPSTAQASVFPQAANTVTETQNLVSGRSNILSANSGHGPSFFAGLAEGEFILFFDSSSFNADVNTDNLISRIEIGPGTATPETTSIYNLLQTIFLSDEGTALENLISGLGSHGNTNDAVITGDGLANTSLGISDNEFNSILPISTTLSDFIEIHNYWLANQFDTNNLPEPSSPAEFDYDEDLNVNTSIFVSGNTFIISSDNIYIPSSSSTVRAYTSYQNLVEKLDLLFDNSGPKGTPIERRIIELNARLGRVNGIGLPVFIDGASPSPSGYTKQIYDSVNPMLKGHVEYLQIIIDDLQNVQVLYDEITNLRNKRAALLQARG